MFRGLEIVGLLADEELVSRLAAEIASPGVELREEGGVVRYRVYLPLADAAASAGRLRDLWAELGGDPAATLRGFREPERDWGAETRRGFRGTAVGPFWIGPPWLEPPPERVALRINPGRAFGTGLHPTTRIALRLLAGAAPLARARVLDVGAGSGVLGLAALALGAARVVALDLDPHALANAAENRALNEAAGRLHLIAGSPAALAPAVAFDLVLANLETAILAPLLRHLSRLLSPGGRLLVSGVTREQREGLLGVARGQGLHCRRRLSQDGWWGGELAARVSPARPRARAARTRP